MKKILLSIFIMFVSCEISCQRKEMGSFEEKILKLKLKKNKKVSKQDYDKGKYIFEETIKQIKRDSLKFNYIDYWNLSVAQRLLGEDQMNIRIAFNKSYALNPVGVCQLLNFLKSNKITRYNDFVKIVPRIYTIINDCEIVKSKKFDINNYSLKNELNVNLIRLIYNIKIDDQKHRKGNSYFKNKISQKALDSINIIKIDSLYSSYKSYIGRSLVGKDLEFVMWSVIQHSNISKMEEYLPVICQAVKDKELKLTPLKMLIDRIYTIRKDYQIFGSQMSVEMADEGIRKKVITKYALEGIEL